MSLESKMHDLWRPSAEIETLRARARIIQSIRDFFNERGAFEVDVPLLSQGVALDAGLSAFALNVQKNASTQTRYFLQTSPEFGMKRLLAAGSGAIYYLGKACRLEETSRAHNPEFTMLEWYRPGFTPGQLVAETGELLTAILNTPPPQVMTYADVFAEHFGINPHGASTDDLISLSIKHGFYVESLSTEDKGAWLDLLFSHAIEPQLGWTHPQVISEFPICQASLSKAGVNELGEPVAMRFEFYIQGRELANGYHELTDPSIQAARFESDLAERTVLGLDATLPKDSHLLAALESGLPESCGIALGVDRLVMFALKKEHIKEVITFDFERA